MSQNNVTSLIITLVNLSVFGFTISPLFKEMNLLRFILIGFWSICILSPLITFWEDKNND